MSEAENKKPDASALSQTISDMVAQISEAQGIIELAMNDLENADTPVVNALSGAQRILAEANRAGMEA